MKPQLGDTILNRYTLVSSLREEPGIQAWKANDRVLAKDCQLFIITNRSAFAAIDELAGRIAATRPDRVIPVLKYRMESDVLLIVMPVDSGQCLTDYMADTAKPLSYSAIRSIIGECADVLREVIADTPSGIVVTTDTVRVTTSGVHIADAPCATMLADTSATDLRTDGPERYAIRQLAALLYALLTRTPSQATPTFNLRALPQDTPGEFRVICKRGLALSEPDEHTLPMAALVELDALLGNWKPLSELSDADIALPSVESDCSITKAILKPANETDIVPIPSTLINSSSLPELSITPSLPVQTAAVPTPHAMSPVPLPDGSGTADGNQSQSDARRLFDFNLSEAWEHENLSGEDTGDWYSEMNPAPIGGPGDNTRLTVPIVTGGISDATVGETTSRIPVFDASGRAVAPGEESLRALEEEQARIAEVSAIPPSFTPKDVPDDEVDSKLPDEHLFGKLSTKVVAIIVALILVVAAAVWAVYPPGTILPMLPATPVKVTGLISMLTLCHLVAARTRRTVAPLTIPQSRVMPLRANPGTRHQTSPRSPRLLIRRPRRPRPRSPAIRIPALLRNRAMRTTRRLRFPVPTSYRILAANPGTHTTCTLTSRRMRTAWLSPSAHPVVRAIFAQIPLETPLRASRWPNSPLLKVALLR